MKNYYSKIVILMLASFGLSTSILAQCTTPGSQLATITPGASYQTIYYGGGTINYYSFNAVAGGTYTFSYCTGGGSYSGDPYLTILNAANVGQAQSDDFCSLGSQITWTCPTNGTYKIVLSGCCPCGAPPSATLAYACTSCAASCTYTVPFSGSNTITANSGTICDHAGTSNYSNYANGYTVINPTAACQAVRLTFNAFTLESCCDYIAIYNGVGTGGTLLYGGPGTGGTMPPVVTSNSGPLTLLFYSDGSITYAGFTATISNVAIAPVPAAPTAVSASPATICAGASVNLNATSAGNTIRWYTVATGGANIGTSASGANFALSPATTTTYYAEAFTPCSAVSATRTAVTVTVNPVPAAPTAVTATAAAICAGASSNLNATSAGNTIRWYTVATGGSNIGTSASGANFAVTPATTTTYYAEAFTGASCPSATRTAVTVTVGALPSAPTPVTASPASICAGASSNLNATSAGNTINWYTVASGGSALGNVASGANYSVTPAVTTTYYAEAVTSGGGGSTVATGTIAQGPVTLPYVPGSTPMGVVWNPTFSLYYSTTGGGAGTPLITYNAAGTQLSSVGCNVDARGSWWNSNTSKFEINSYGSTGYDAVDLNGSGWALATGVISPAGQQQPNSQSMGGYDPVNNETVFFDAGSIYRRNRTTGAVVASGAITGLPGGSINTYWAAYSGVPGAEIMIYDYTNRAVRFINRLTFAYTSSAQLAAGAPAPSSYNIGYDGNGKLWLHNGTAWVSYQVVTLGGGGSGTQTFNYTGSLQTFTVPAGVTSITINAKGGQGGAGGAAVAGSGGLGANMTGTFTVTPGQVLKVLVGQQGPGNAGTAGAGGGGGTFVTDNANNPMIIAGGGGGRHGTLAPVGMDANTGTSGSNGYSTAAGYGTYYGVGGTSGNGATNGPNPPHAGNGGGLLTSGAAGQCGGPGQAFTLGGAGGATCGGAAGGYGAGGGGGNNGAGGGGGYSGGGGAYHTPTNGGGGGSYNTGTSPTNLVNNTGNGQVILTWTSVGASCPSATRTAVTVTVNPIPAAPTAVTATAATICVGASSNLNATSAGNTIRWYTVASGGSNIGTSASGANFAVTPATTTTYYAEAFTPGSCVSATRTAVTVTVNPVPAAPTPVTATAATICAGASSNLNATSAGNTINWYTVASGGSTIGTSASAANFAVTPATTTTYYAEAFTGVSCPSATRTAVTVTVSPLPVAPTPVTASPATICAGASSNLNATSAGNTINWYTVASGGSTIGTSASAANFSVTPPSTTNYYAEALASVGGSSGTQTFNYTGAVQTFTVPAGVTTVTINAYGAEGLGFNGFTPGQGGRAQGDLTVTPGQVLNIYVGGQAGFNGGGAGKGGANGGDASDVRVGGTALGNRVIVAGGGGGAGGDNWSCFSGNGDGGGGTAVGANFVGGGGGSGYSFCGANGGNTGGTSSSATHGGGGGGGGLTSGGAGAASSIGTAGTGALGLGGAAYMSASCGYTGGGGGGYYGGGGAAGNNCGAGQGGGGSSWTGSLTSPLFAPGVKTGLGQIILTWTSVGTSCPSATRTAVTVTVNPLPAAPTAVTATSPSICVGSSSNLNATSSGNTIRWYTVASGGSNIGTSASAANFAVTPATTTTYYAEAFTPGSCVSATRTAVTVTVNPLPAAPTPVTATAASICVGSSSNLNATSVGNTINWYTVASGGSTIGTSASAANFAVTPATTTTYYAESFTGVSCPSATRTAVTVTVSPLPVAPTPVTASPATICAGASSNLNATSAGNTINWYTVASGGSTIGTSASAANFAVTPASTSTYYAEALTSGGGGSGTQTFSYTGSLQSFTVPAGVTSITIDARGAQGGGSNGGAGGLGARMTGTHAVTAGQVLSIVVGQQGLLQVGGNVQNSSGGGGGTFVYTAGPTLLVAAGGGGGKCNYTGSAPLHAAAAGQITTNGGASSNGNAGGTGGNGGNTGAWPGGGGAGWLTNGVGPYGGVTYPSLTGGPGYCGGGGGGCGGAGGYGGGGGGGNAYGGGGGGGGYSGGGGGTDPTHGGGGGSFSSGTSQANTIGFQTGNGQVIISWTAPAGVSCPSATRTAVTVTVDPLPAAPTAVTATAPSICVGSSSNLNATSSGNTIRWYTVASGGSNIGTSASAANFAVTPATTTTYYAEAFTPGSCVSATRTAVMVTVNPIPAAPTPVTATAASICVGASSNLNATSAGNTINWYTVASGGSNIGTSASAANFAVTPATTTTYYAEALVASLCPSTTRTAVTVTVNPNNTVNLSSAAGTNAQVRCVNTAITNITYATTSATGATFSGLPAGVTGVWAGNVVTISGTPSATGTYPYTVTLTGGCGNITASGTIDVTPAATAPTSVTSTPSVFCPGATVQLSAITAGTTISWYTVPTGGVTIGTSASGANFAVTPSITTTYYAEAAFVGGCISSRTPVIATRDNVLPTISWTGGTQTVNLGVGCSATVPDYTASPSITKGDNCGTPSVTQSPAAGTVLNAVGSTTVTLTATDGSSNTATTTFTLNRVDVTNPTISWIGGTQTVNLGGACTVAMPDYTTSLSITKADNCTAIPVVTQSPLAATVLSGVGSTTVTLTATDASGNTSTTTFTLNRVDVSIPTISWTGGTQTINLNGSCSATVPNYTTSPSVVAADGCTATPTITQSPAAGSALSGVGATTITLTATDASNNTATTTFTLNRVDVTNPTISWAGGAQTINLDASCGALVPDYTASPSITKADNCTALPVVTQSPAAGSALSGVGSTTITLTATDASNNTATTTFTLNRVDVTNPTISWTGGTQTVNLGVGCTVAMPDYTASLSITKADNCTAIPVVTQSPLAATVLSGVGSTTVTLTATDASGNTATTTFTLNRVDVSIPTISWTGGTQTINLNGSCSATVPNYTTSPLVVAADGCTATPTITQSPAAGSALSGVGATTITLTATDASNNTATTTFTLNRVDVTNPTISWTGGAQTINLDASCGALVPDYTASPSITKADNCTALPVVTQSPAAGSALSGVGSTTITLTATDASNNTATTTFTLNRVDVTAPTISWIGGTQTVNLGGACTVAMPDYTASLSITKADNCTAIPVVTQSPLAATVLSGVGSTTVTLTATDASGNTSTTTFTLNRVDVSIPTISWTGGTQTINLDGSCGAVVPDYTTSPSVVAADGCTATPTITQSPAAGSALSGVGSTTITLTATDASNNTATTTFTLNRVDVTNPTISWTGGAQTINLDASCGALVPDYTASPSITKADNCTALPVVTQSPAAGTVISAVGSTTITLTATDASNNTATTTFTLNRVDVIAPTISWTGGTQTVNLGGACTVAMPDYTASLSITTADNCTASPVITQSPLAATVLSGVGSTTVTLTATDASGNTATTTFTLNRVDVSIPTISWTGGTQTINLDASCGAVVPDYTTSPSVIAADGCTATPTITQSPAAGSALSGVGSTTITLTATDASNNTATTTFTLNRVDVTNPTISWTGGAQTINLDASCGALVPDYTASPSITKADNCTALPVVTQSPAAGSALSGVGSTTITLTATDASNNTATTTFTLNRVDVTNPTISWTGGTQTVNLGGACTVAMPDYTASLSITKADNCTAIPVVTQSPLAATVLSGVGSTTVTLTATDASGNTATTTFTLNRVDVSIPTISWTGGTQTINLDGSCGAVVPDYTTSPSVVAADGCTATPTITQSPAAGSALSGVGSTTITLTATDASNNTATTTFTLNRVDVTNPTISWTGGAQTINLDASCGALVPDYTASPSITKADNCTALPVVTQSPAAGTVISAVGSTTITLTATDASNNTATTTFTLNRVDVIAPTISWTGGTQTVNLGGACTVAMPDYTASLSITTADNCTASPVITQSPLAATVLSGVGSTTVTLTATDASGNTATTTFTLNRVDVSIPTISWTGGTQTINLDASCGAVVPDYTTSPSVIAADGCTATPTITQSPAAGSALSGVGSTTITLTATDASNNTATTTFTLNRVDVTNPTISWTGGAQTINLDASCGALVPDYTASPSITKADNCTALPVVTQSPAAGSALSGVGSTTITLTATDASNNTATTTFTLNRVDVTNPTISWTGGTQTVNLGGACTVAMPDYTASLSITTADNCTVSPVVTQSPLAATVLSGVGSTTVTLTATDASGNTATTTFTLNRVDVSIPTISWTGGTQTINLDASCGAVVPDYTTSPSVVAADGCTATPTITQSPAAGSALSGVGATTVTLTATDASSNTATTTFTINTVDVTNPVAIAPANMAVSNDIGSCGAIVNFSVSATDNCSGSTVLASPASGSFFPIGTTTVLVVANDGSNNQGFATFDVVVTDTELPVIMGTPSNITVSNDAGSCGAVVTWTAPTAMDNCPGSTVSTSMASGSSFPIGTTTVTVNAMDANGNPASSSFTVTVNDTELPVLTVPGAQTVNLDNMCQATVPDLVALSSATDNCMAGLVITQSPLAGSPIVSSSPVTVTITATDASMNTASNTVTVTPNVAVASITPSGPTTFCDGGNVWLIAPVNPTYTYQWYNNGTAMPGATVDSAMMDASGSYWVEVTVPGACTMVSPPISVTELAIPAAPTNITITAPVGATNPVTICNGTNVSMMYSGASPANEYLWSINGTYVNYALTPSSTFASNALLAGSNNVQLQVIYTAGPVCWSAPASVTVIKNTAPATTLTAAGPTVFCANTPTILNASPNTAGLTYVWRRSNVVIPSATTASYAPVQSGNHNVTITGTNGCSKTSPWLNVTVNPLPVANAGIDRNLCNGASVQIGSTTNGANSYTWSPTTALSNPSISNPMTSATTTTTYTVTVTNTSTGCVNTDAMVLTSLPQPTTPTLAISGMPGASSVTTCQGTNVVLVPTSSGTANLWYKNGGGNPTYTYSPSTTLTLTAPNVIADVWTIKAKDANNCVSNASNPISVLIKANPVPTITPLGTNGIIDVCLNGQPTAAQVLTANVPVGSPSAIFTWQQYASGVYTTVGTGLTYTSTVGSAAGQTQKVYRVVANYTNSCIRNSSNKTVKVLAGCKGDGTKNGDEIIEITTDSDVVVAYPNPTSGMLNVDIENSEATEGKLVLYNALGQIVVERVVMLEGGKASEILDLTNVAIGVYTLSFQTENGQKTQKVVKE